MNVRKQRLRAFRASLRWNLDDGTEEYYNCSLGLMDWNKIILG